MASRTYRRAIEPLQAEIGNELVTLDPEAGNCFGFNEVAATIWRRLAKPQTFDQLRDALLDEYEVSADQCAEDLQQLLDELVEQRLLIFDAEDA